MRKVLTMAAGLLFAGPVQAQDAAPLTGPKPVFRPGYYETDSRNSHWPDQPTKAKICISDEDFDTFRRNTLNAYKTNAQFKGECELSEDKVFPDGFAFAMNCKHSKIIRDLRFKGDVITDTMGIENPEAPMANQKILSIMHRIGDCPGGTGKGT